MRTRGDVHGQDVWEEGNEEDGGVRDVGAALPAGDGVCIQLQQKLGGGKTATKKASVTWREEAVSPGSCLRLPDPAHRGSAFVLNVPRTISNTS